MFKRIAFSLLAFSSILVANWHENGGCYRNSKECIDCECFSPSTYNLDCATGMFVSVDFLYWYAKETNLSYAMKAKGVSQRPVNAGRLTAPDTYALASKYKDLGAKWDPGFRFGIGWDMDCDGWDLYLNWTYYHNRKKEKTEIPVPTVSNGLVSAPGIVFIQNPWNDMAVWQANFWDFVSAKWTLNYNVIDLELGRKFWTSRCFSIRPYIGLRGAWTKTNFNLFSELGPYTGSFRGTNLHNILAKAHDNFTNRLWGVGLLAGLQPYWNFHSNFFLFGDFDLALIWGKFQANKSINYQVTANSNLDNAFFVLERVRNTSHRNLFRMQAVLDLFLGVRWEKNWCCDRYLSSFDLGWENHIWFEHGAYTKNTDLGGNPANAADAVYARTYFDEITNLVLGGIVARARFDF